MPAPRGDAPFRPNLYVVARFLDALARPDATLTRAQLQAACGVNYDVYRRYEAFLQAKSYVVASERGEVGLTAEGRRVRDELRAWLARFLGAEPDAAAAAGPPQAHKDERSSPAPP